MGNPLSVVLAGIHMAKMENDIVKPENPILYARYVDDIFRRRKINENDDLFVKINNHHANLDFIIETKLEKFLDTKLNLVEGTYITAVNRKKQIAITLVISHTKEI